MKIESLLEHLQNPLQHLVRVSSKNSTLTSLQGVLLETKSNKLILTTTNLDIGLSITVPVKTTQEGSVLINADVFSKVITNIPTSEKKVTIELIGEVVHITTLKTSITVNTLPKEEFPKLPTIEGVSVGMQKQILTDGIKNVVFATATTDIKPEISSVYFYTETGHIIFVGTDSFRLAEKKIKIKSTEEVKVLLPSKNALEIVKILELTHDDIVVTYSETMMTITSQDMYITTRVVDGVFPDYKRIIPQEVTTEVKVLKQDLINVFKMTSLFSDAFNQIKLTVSNNEIVWETKNQNIGSVTYEVPSKNTGKEIVMNFNFRYIQEALSVIQKESISFYFMNEQKAALLRQVGDDSFLYLVMPLNR
jgi:DNA polymerase III subunit beta